MPAYRRVEVSLESNLRAQWRVPAAYRPRWLARSASWFLADWGLQSLATRSGRNALVLRSHRWWLKCRLQNWLLLVLADDWWLTFVPQSIRYCLVPSVHRNRLAPRAAWGFAYPAWAGDQLAKQSTWIVRTARNYRAGKSAALRSNRKWVSRIVHGQSWQPGCRLHQDAVQKYLVPDWCGTLLNHY